MTKINDGGPAFPHEEPLDRCILFPGMSLRDRVAIEALGGMLAHSTRYRPRQGSPANWHEAIAEEAYQIADAMLRERSKSQGQEQ